jgi:elongation factor 1-beta
MAGIVGVKVKLMPESPEVNLEEIESKAKEIVEKSGGNNKEYEIQPIAFGLKALIVFFFYDEEKDTSEIEQKLREIDKVQSAEIIDLRKIA